MRSQCLMYQRWKSTGRVDLKIIGERGRESEEEEGEGERQREREGEGRRGGGRRGERGRDLTPRGSQLTAVQQKHKHYSRPWSCCHPEPHMGEVGGAGEGTHRAAEQGTRRHETLYGGAPTFKQTHTNHHTHPHIEDHCNDYTIRASGHSCMSAIQLGPGSPWVRQSAFCIAQHAQISVQA